MLKSDVCVFSADDVLYVHSDFTVPDENGKDQLFRGGSNYKVGTSYNNGGSWRTAFFSADSFRVVIDHEHMLRALNNGWAGIVDTSFGLWTSVDPKGVTWARATGYEKCFYLGACTTEGESQFKRGCYTAVQVRLSKKSWAGPLVVWEMAREGVRPVAPKKFETVNHVYSPYVVSRVSVDGSKERICVNCGAGEKTTVARTCLPEASTFDVKKHEECIATDTKLKDEYKREEREKAAKKQRMLERELPGICDSPEWKRVH
jgi:hypothetical protein